MKEWWPKEITVKAEDNGIFASLKFFRYVRTGMRSPYFPYTYPSKKKSYSIKLSVEQMEEIRDQIDTALKESKKIQDEYKQKNENVKEEWRKRKGDSVFFTAIESKKSDKCKNCFWKEEEGVIILARTDKMPNSDKGRICGSDIDNKTFLEAICLQYEILDREDGLIRLHADGDYLKYMWSESDPQGYLDTFYWKYMEE